MKTPGKKLLKVVGILLVIFGVLGLLGTALNFFITSSMTPEMEELMAQSGYSYSAADLRASNIWNLVSSVLWLLAGIVGIKNCSRTDKAKICVVFGGLMIAEILAQAVFNLAGGAFAIVGTVINLIMPLLYFWGAMKNLQAGAAAEPPPVDGVADILEVSSEQMRRGVKKEEEDR